MDPKHISSISSPQTVSGVDLRERIEEALFGIDCCDAGEAYDIVSNILDRVYQALKRNAQFAGLSHGHFDLLTADIRERASRDLGERIDGLADLDDVSQAIDDEFAGAAADAATQTNGRDA